jgi:hypothetical protein
MIRCLQHFWFVRHVFHAVVYNMATWLSGIHFLEPVFKSIVGSVRGQELSLSVRCVSEDVHGSVVNNVR